MDPRNDHAPPRPWSTPTGPWSSARDLRQGAAPEDDRPTLATPVAWLGGGLLLAGSTFLVSVIALVRAFGALFR